MLTLAIDTSAGTAVALLDVPAGGPPTVLAQAAGADPRAHAEQLAPMVADVLRTARAAAADVELVAVGTGPAPFTGLRVGLVSARTFAHALGIEVVGVASLDALARTVLDRAPGDAAQVVVATDARRREVYVARYAARGADDVTRLAGPHVTAPAEALAAVGLGDDGGPGTPDVLLAGPGCALAPEHLPATPGLPDAIDLAALARIAHARRAARAAGHDVALDTEPLYLRRPDIHGAPGAP